MPRYTMKSMVYNSNIYDSQGRYGNEEIPIFSLWMFFWIFIPNSLITWMNFYFF
jgi:hypothetical protein